jgi:hypothetical protein
MLVKLFFQSVYFIGFVMHVDFKINDKILVACPLVDFLLTILHEGYTRRNLLVKHQTNQ